MSNGYVVEELLDLVQDTPPSISCKYEEIIVVVADMMLKLLVVECMRTSVENELGSAALRHTNDVTWLHGHNLATCPHGHESSDLAPWPLFRWPTFGPCVSWDDPSWDEDCCRKHQNLWDPPCCIYLIPPCW